MADFPYAEWLTRQYKERAKGSNYWTDYIKAHALANYCLVKHPTDERRELVFEIERSWYKDKHPLKYEEHQKKTKEHKQLLKNFRDDARPRDLGKRHHEVITNDVEVLSPANIDRAKRFSSDVFQTSERCTQQFLSVSKSIIKSSVELLHQAGKVAPCKFAVVGLGSAAKGEVTPYSDLEYAFIVEHEDEYFQALAVDSYFRIGNLGETPLKCLDIKELKVEKGSTPILSRNHTVGYRIDGITEKAGNIPTGNGREDGQKLTLTVDDLMKLYRTSAQSPFDGVAGDKSDMLSSTVLIYTNEERERESHLYQQFLEKRKMAESELTSNKDVIIKRLASFTKDVESYTFLLEFIEFQPPENRNVEVKADIFRYPTLLANHLRLWLTLEDRYPWQVYDRLQEKGVVTEETCSYLKIILAIALYMRIGAYLCSRTQTETLSYYPNTPEFGKTAYDPQEGLSVIYGCLLSSIKHQIREETKSKKVTDATHLKAIGKDLLGKLKIVKDDLLLQAEVNYFIGRYEPAMEIMSQGIKCDILNSDSSTVITCIQQIDSTSTNKYVQLCTYLIYYTGNYTTAADYLQWLINTQPGDNSFWKLLLAFCMLQKEDYKSARLLLNQVKRSNREDSLLHSISSRSSAHSDYWASVNHIGVLYSELGDHKMALRYFEECLKMSKDLPGINGYRLTATSYMNVGGASSALGRFPPALENLTQALDMFERFGHQSKQVAQACYSIGQVYRQQGDVENALSYLNRALNIKQHIFGSTTNHPEVAAIYREIGDVYKKKHDCQTARDYYIKSLVMLKKKYGKDANCLEIACGYNSLGLTYFNEGDYQRALRSHVKALEMEKAIYGSDENHPHIAIEHFCIADCYRKEGNFDKALEHHIKSLEVYKSVHSFDTNHPDIAESHMRLGRVYELAGNYQKAEMELKKALTMMEAIPEEDRDHDAIAIVQQLLAILPKRRQSI